MTWRDLSTFSKVKHFSLVSSSFSSGLSCDNMLLCTTLLLFLCKTNSLLIYYICVFTKSPVSNKAFFTSVSQNVFPKVTSSVIIEFNLFKVTSLPVNRARASQRVRLIKERNFQAPLIQPVEIRNCRLFCPLAVLPSRIFARRIILRYAYL